MRYLVIFCLLFLALPDTHGQTLTISARALDKETKEPLPYASVGIKGKPIGTIANLQGEFDFHFPAEYENELFVISMLGYANYEVVASALLKSKVPEILLDKSNTILQTVVISDSLNGGEILRIAMKRIEQNYPMKPFLMDGFYRDLKKVGGTYISLLEAAIKIFDNNYKEPRNKSKLREQVSLQEVRRSLGYGNKFTTYFDRDNLLEVLLLNNDMRYRLMPEEDVFYNRIKRQSDSYYNGHDVFVVTSSKEFKLQVFIDKKTYAIIHLEYENTIPEDLGKKSGLERKFESLKRVVDFKFYEGKFFLNYLTVDYRVNWYDPDTHELKFETELQQILLINHVVPNVTNNISFPGKMRRYGLQYQDQPYNKKFWEEYNVVKESPLDKSIIADLELDGPLEKQFEKNQR